MALIRTISLALALAATGCRDKPVVAPKGEVDLRALPSPALDMPSPPPAGADAERAQRPPQVEPAVERPPPMGADALREAGLRAPAATEAPALERPPPMGADALRERALRERAAGQ